MTDSTEGPKRDSGPDQQRPKKKYRKRPAAKWRTLIFTPEGGDPSQSIRFRGKGFMYLCEQLCDGKPPSGYCIDDTNGIIRQESCLSIKWTDFRAAFYKYRARQPVGKPSVFQGEYYPPEHSIRLRKRMLAAALREYIGPTSLAQDLIEWMSRGRDEDIRRFVTQLLFEVGWLKPPPRTPDEAASKPIERPKGMVLLMA